MPKKKRDPVAPRPCDSWTIVTEMQIHGRNVTVGTELKIAGVTGRFTFQRYVDTGEHQWVDVWGGPAKAERFRSFRLDRIKTVHTTKQSQTALAAEYKAKRKIQLASK